MGHAPGGFSLLKNYLLPPTDRALSALLDDLYDRGMLDDTLVVMASEFGRTQRYLRYQKLSYRAETIGGRSKQYSLQEEELTVEQLLDRVIPMEVIRERST